MKLLKNAALYVFLTVVVVCSFAMRLVLGILIYAGMQLALIDDAYVPEDLKDTLVSVHSPITSPSGKYVLTMKTGKFKYEGDSTVEVEHPEKTDADGFWISVLSADDGKEVFISEEFYGFLFDSNLFWQEGDVIWLYSGDVGTFSWTPDGDGRWIKRGYGGNVEERAAIPALIKRLQPNTYQ